MFGFFNEFNGNVISKGFVVFFYIEVYNIICDIIGIGVGNGLMFFMYDGFLGVVVWYGDFVGVDCMMFD